MEQERIKDVISHPYETKTEHTDKESYENGKKELEKINREKADVIGTIKLCGNITSKTKTLEDIDTLQKIIEIDQKDEENQEYYNDITKKALKRVSSNISLKSFVFGLTLYYRIYLRYKPLEELIGFELDPI